MISNGTKWAQMDTKGLKWAPTVSTLKWDQMDSNELKMSQMGSNETKEYKIQSAEIS